MDHQLSPGKTALVVIDLQKGIMARTCAPLEPATVVQGAARLATAFRALGAFVVLVHVDTRDGKDMLRPNADSPMSAAAAQRPPDFGQFVPELGPMPTDHLVTKHNWGAFHGTDLDLQLRRRGIETIVLCGIATNFGVETTAREAFQHGYQQIFAVDAMTALSAEEHAHTVKYIFPRIGRVRTVEEIIRLLPSG